MALGFWGYLQLQKRNELLEMQARLFESGSKKAKKSKKKRRDNGSHLRGSDSVGGDSEYEKFMSEVRDTDQSRDEKTGEPIVVVTKKMRERLRKLDLSIAKAESDLVQRDSPENRNRRTNSKFPKLTAANLRKLIPDAEYKGDLFRDYLKGRLGGGRVSPEGRNNARIFLAKDIAPPRDLELEQADWSMMKNEMKLKKEKLVEKKKRREEREAIRRDWMRKATKPKSESESTDTPTKKSESEKEEEVDDIPFFFNTGYDFIRNIKIESEPSINPSSKRGDKKEVVKGDFDGMEITKHVKTNVGLNLLAPIAGQDKVPAIETQKPNPDVTPKNEKNTQKSAASKSIQSKSSESSSSSKNHQDKNQTGKPKVQQPGFKLKSPFFKPKN